MEEEVRLTHPLKRPNIRGLFPKKCPELPRIQMKAGQEYRLSGTDSFRLLPLEMRTLVASYLSTAEFFNLRRVSRSMAEVFEDRQFWRTRFFPHGERGYLNFLLRAPELEHDIKKARRYRRFQSSKETDWRLIYRCSVRLSEWHDRLFELRRRWHNNRWLADRYAMTKPSDEEIKSHGSLDHDMPWQGVHLKARCDRLHNQLEGNNKRKCERCNMAHHASIQSVPLNESVVSLAVYVLREAYHTYITGFGLLKRDGGKPSLVLGYCIPDQYMLINIFGKQLMGFNLIVGDNGIYAIQADFKVGSSSWVGNKDGSRRCQWITGICNQYNTHRDAPRLVRLTTEKGVQALSVRLDVSQTLRQNEVNR